MLARSNDFAARSLEGLATNGILYHYLGIADSPQSNDLAILMLLLFSDDGIVPAAWPGEAKPGFFILQKWLEVPDEASLGVIASLVSLFELQNRLQSRKALPHSKNKKFASALRLLAERNELYKM